MTTQEAGARPEFSGQPGESYPSSGRRISYIGLLAALILLLIPSYLAVSRQSLWIDEAASCYFADHAPLFHLPQFSGLAAVPQMPAFHILLAIWVRCFGDSEFALRAINLPFAALFLASLLFLSRRAGRRSWFLVVPFAFFPLLIYYMNESCPYVAILACSTAALVVLCEHRRTGSAWSAWLCMFFTLAVFALHLLGALTIGLILFYCLFDSGMRHRIRMSWRLWIAPLGVFFFASIGLLAYYKSIKSAGLPSGYSLTPGATASTWKNVVFFFYEALGFDGLGPPRNDMRIHATVHTFLPFASAMAFGAAALVPVLFLLFAGIKNKPEVRQSINILFATCITLGLFFLAARAIHFGFFGRHAMPLVAALCCAALLVLSAEKTSAAWRMVAVLLLSCAWAFSSWHFVFQYSYGKDDPRTALQLARQARLPILWNADMLSANYYGACDAPVQPRIYSSFFDTGLQHWNCSTEIHELSVTSAESSLRSVDSIPAGQYMLVLGKEDAYDPEGVIHKALATWNPLALAQLNGYQIYAVSVPARSIAFSRSLQ